MWRGVFVLVFTLFVASVVSAECVQLDPGNITVLPGGVTQLCPGEHRTFGLIIEEDHTTLDCQDAVITGEVTVGVFIDEVQNTTIVNCVIQRFSGGIVMKKPGRVVLDNVTLADNIFGVAVFVHSSLENTSIFWNAQWKKNKISYVKSYVDVKPIYPAEFTQIIELARPKIVAGGVITENLTRVEAFAIPPPVVVPERPPRPTRDKEIAVVLIIIVAVVFFSYLLWRQHKRMYFAFPK